MFVWRSATYFPPPVQAAAFHRSRGRVCVVEQFSGNSALFFCFFEFFGSGDETRGVFYCFIQAWGF